MGVLPHHFIFQRHERRGRARFVRHGQRVVLPFLPVEGEVSATESRSNGAGSGRCRLSQQGRRGHRPYLHDMVYGRLRFGRLAEPPCAEMVERSHARQDDVRMGLRPVAGHPRAARHALCPHEGRADGLFHRGRQRLWLSRSDATLCATARSGDSGRMGRVVGHLPQRLQPVRHQHHGIHHRSGRRSEGPPCRGGICEILP